MLVSVMFIRHKFDTTYINCAYLFVLDRVVSSSQFEFELQSFFDPNYEEEQEVYVKFGQSIS
jgi:hypothetical protein